jgi:hypothetical protein
MTLAMRSATAHAAPLPSTLGFKRWNSPAKNVSLVWIAAQAIWVSSRLRYRFPLGERER